MGAAAAQPDRAAAQDPAAVHPGRDDDLGALPAALLPHRRGARGAAGRGARRPRLPRLVREHAPRSSIDPGPPASAVGPVAAGRRRRGRRSSGRAAASARGTDARRGALRRRGRAGRARRPLSSRGCPPTLPEVGGSVVFVRHALPGEQVTVEVTEGEVGDRFLRGDAVAVHEPSPDRVVPPCPYAGPGRCGGCDFQHVDLAAQRRLKAEVVAEQLRRLAGLDRGVVVEPVPGDDDGLRWRTRMRFHRPPDGAARAAGRTLAPGRARRRLPHRRPRTPDHRRGRGRAREPVVEKVRGRRFEVAADGFWQVAPRRARDAGRRGARRVREPRAGDRVLDLYSGVGLFTAFLADAVGPTGRVVAVEGDRTAVDARAGQPRATPVGRGAARRGRPRARAPAGAASRRRGPRPAAGGRQAPVVEEVVALAPRTVVHVACDPASFARDTALFARGRLPARRRCAPSTSSR